VKQENQFPGNFWENKNGKSVLALPVKFKRERAVWADGEARAYSPLCCTQKHISKYKHPFLRKMFIAHHCHCNKQCTGNGLVVPSSSHKREVAGFIPAGCTKTFLSPLPLLPHRLMSYFEVGRHLSIHENPHKKSQQQDNSSTPPPGEKKVLPRQSTGEKINYTVQLVTCQYWYKL
jgi:hypothetical protein